MEYRNTIPILQAQILWSKKKFGFGMLNYRTKLESSIIHCLLDGKRDLAADITIPIYNAICSRDGCDILTINDNPINDMDGLAPPVVCPKCHNLMENVVPYSKELNNYQKIVARLMICECLVDHAMSSDGLLLMGIMCDVEDCNWGCIVEIPLPLIDDAECVIDTSPCGHRLTRIILPGDGLTGSGRDSDSNHLEIEEASPERRKLGLRVVCFFDYDPDWMSPMRENIIRFV